MSKKDKEGPIRRTQLIAPFGPGALYVLPSGYSVICSGLDFWYHHCDSNELSKFCCDDPRLTKLLHCDNLYLPPGYQKGIGIKPLTIPVTSFPKWYYCSRCGRMEKYDDIDPQHTCTNPECGGKGKGKMVQVPLVAICKRGHIQEFPWREWLFKTTNLTEEQKNIPIFYVKTGSNLLGNIDTKEGHSRNLQNVSQSDLRLENNTYLSNTLSSTEKYLCEGHMPWLGNDYKDPHGCGEQLIGVLRNALNVYYPLVESSLYVPQELIQNIALSNDAAELLQKMRHNSMWTKWRACGKLSQNNIEGKFDDCCDNIILCLYQAVLKTDGQAMIDRVIDLFKQEDQQQISVSSTQTPEDYRQVEYQILVKVPKHTELVLEKLHEPWTFSEYFSTVTLVRRLRDTRALYGFTRFLPPKNKSVSVEEKKYMLRRDTCQDNWLPAYTALGEGLFFQLNEKALCQWENRPEVRERFERYSKETSGVSKPSPRFVLVHTLAHLVMLQLSAECGYNTASIRERLYVSTDPKKPMAGFLIYTSSGDSEGTLGGLVRMGKATRLDKLFDDFIQKAKWCSFDPICMETVHQGGSDQVSSGAACYACCFTPETSCEEFNSLLDRAMVIGTFDVPSIGYLIEK